MGKVKKVHLTLNNKHDILGDLAAKIDRSVICKKYAITNGTISKIIKKKCSIEERFQHESGNVKHSRPSDYPMLDKALLECFQARRSQNIPLNGPILQEKATQFSAKLNIKLKKDEVSEGFISTFKKRHNIQFRVISGEAGAVNTGVINDWILNTWSKLRDGYSNDDIFNADECGLFYKMLPCNLNRMQLKARMIDDGEEEPPTVSSSEAMRCIYQIRDYLFCHMNCPEQSENLCSSLGDIEHLITKTRLLNLKQKSITSYFKSARDSSTL